MSTMKAADKLRAMAGANIAESMGRGTGATPPGFTPVRPSEQDRFAGLNRVKGAFQIPLDRIVRDEEQPRKEFEAESLERLAASLRERGQLQAIRVRWDGTMDKWVIIAGERRWRAAAMIGMTTIAAVEATASQSEDEVLEDQLVENCVREDLKPIEQARAFEALMERRSWTATRLAEALSLNDSTVIRALALLGLPCTVQDRVETGEIAPSVAYEISKVEDADKQAELAAQVIADGLSRAETVEAVKRVAGRSKTKGRGGSKAKKETSRSLKTSNGVKLTLERSKGLDVATILVALAEAVERIQAESGKGQAAA
jgi:ParB family chromosome partitioning protein